MQKDMAEAIEIQNELVDLAWFNHPTATFAAALENLASAFEILEKVRQQPIQKGTALREAIAALEGAANAYRMDDDAAERAIAVESRLDELRSNLGGPSS